MQAVAFERPPCPGLPPRAAWESTHFVRLRATGAFNFRDLDVRLENESGAKFLSRGVVGDTDPDVRGYRFQVEDGAPTRVVVTLRGTDGR